MQQLEFKFYGYGRMCTMYAATLPNNEQLRVLVGREFTEEGLLAHVSASIGVTEKTGTKRKPTDEEFLQVANWAKSSLPSVKEFREEPNEGVNKHVRHLWEVK